MQIETVNEERGVFGCASVHRFAGNDVEVTWAMAIGHGVIVPVNNSGGGSAARFDNGRWA